MQGLGGPEEDRRGGFERGGWVTPLFDNEGGTFLNQVYERADAFLFGRRTYELFARSWGTWADPGSNPIWTALNTKPKYVASTTLTDPKWSDTTVLSDDLATAIADLKAKPGGELQVHGSGNLIRWLLEHQLVDELTLLVCPVVLGQGERHRPGHQDRQPGAVELGEQPEADRRQPHAGRHHVGRASPAHQQRGRQGSQDEPQGGGQHPQARLQRRQPQHQLQVLRDEQQGPELDEEVEDIGGQGPR
jgi:dihydrofolate reductase